MSSARVPDVQFGLEYWKTQPASLDGVLGGFGSGSLPRIDSLGSRLFLLSLMPELSTVSDAIRLPGPPPARRTRALDVGAGIGRVTADVLLHLVADVVLLEPVDSFIQEALARARASASTTIPARGQHPWKGLVDLSTSVTFLRGTLQDFDPARPHHTETLDRVGYAPPETDAVSGFDVVWCQWCLGHLSDPELVAFLRRSRAALRDEQRSLIVVKENLCSDLADGRAAIVFDEQDSSLTRSDLAWKDVFAQAGLEIIHEQVQEGLPAGLYVVKMYALR
ncbi:alpha-N-methyltransferase NTM1 [Mycena belliarum]|uniref:Alpha N-terminal protein methyltransferase 1 n=1 Tax=Mycena belliarum TaxID=1033014 RepID=A0AAD6UI70_9AGAR|nr:alpha-N-methyltransferase NTM1 [Mycena belliae]